ncbi:MAG: DUF4199 domain-containing protein [Alistipes sp.]|nr:DUF4199 domain-containing protein [Alistipes sp.]
MEKNNFWNDAARCGAIVGALLGVSYLLETSMQLSGRTSLYALLAIEWIAVFAIHLWLMIRFVRRRAALFSADEGFTFGQGYGYAVTISGFAGFIVGVVQAIWLHGVLGYANYVDKLIAAMTDVVSRSGGFPASMEGAFAQTIAQLQAAPAPSILSTVWGGVFSGLLYGAIFGLIIAAVAARQPRPFGSENSETNE